IKLLRQHAMSVNASMRHKTKKVVFEDHIEIGYNYRMTDIQAAIGIRQLEKLDWIINERRKIALKYIEELKDIDCIRLPIEEEGYFTNYQSFSIYLKENCPIGRNELMQKLLDKGISTRRGIMTSHRETAYKNECSDLKLPISENAADRSIIIPLYIPMKTEEVDFVISNFKEFVK
ncbi:MAG: DegT/DnrJ/EryC1/StrS family aminotransferase, partial [Ignavibacteria bacterium]|nr:DegT/DnrJ/EryC1/StrS family aminotransferase [Ignavibacteria bacterium]